MTRNGTRARGFTLVELLVALAIMAMMAGLAWRALDGMIRARDQITQRSDETLAMQAALSQWGTDLDAVVETQLVNAVDFDGRALRLTRRDATDPVAGVRVVAWTLRAGTQGGTLAALAVPRRAHTGRTAVGLGPGGALGRQPQQRSTPQRSGHRFGPMPGQVFYFREDSWTNPQSSATPQPGNAGGGLVPPPDGVRLVLNLSAGQALAGPITRDWVRPNLNAKKS
jgi:general secretion pathway protein J